MQVKTIVEQIRQLPLSKRFWVMEQTLKSIKKEETNQHIAWDDENADKLYMLSESSLAKDWLTPQEDKAWKDL